MEADMKIIKEDLGADIIRVGEFVWTILEPVDNHFNFTFMDQIFFTAEKFGLKIMLGTPTATMPAWLYTAYPEVALVGPDSSDGFQGATAGFGGRR